MNSKREYQILKSLLENVTIDQPESARTYGAFVAIASELEKAWDREQEIGNKSARKAKQNLASAVGNFRWALAPLEGDEKLPSEYLETASMQLLKSSTQQMVNED